MCKRCTRSCSLRSMAALAHLASRPTRHLCARHLLAASDLALPLHPPHPPCLLSTRPLPPPPLTPTSPSTPPARRSTTVVAVGITRAIVIRAQTTPRCAHSHYPPPANLPHSLDLPRRPSVSPPPSVTSPSDASSHSSHSSSTSTSEAAAGARPLPATDDAINLSSLHFSPFLLGRGDIPSRLQIPNKLYGRETEIAAIRHSFDTVVKGGESIIVCVDGVAGAGKSSTIRQSCAAIGASYPNCLVASSKLDQYNRQPFGMFKQLVSEIVLDILTQPTRVMARWRASVMKAVGSSGALMIDMFPSLQQLIGDQPPVPSPTTSRVAAATAARVHRLPVLLLPSSSSAGDVLRRRAVGGRQLAGKGCSTSQPTRTASTSSSFSPTARRR